MWELVAGCSVDFMFSFSDFVGQAQNNLAASCQKLELLRLSLKDRIDELPEKSPLKEEMLQELEAANSDCIHRTSQPTNRLARPAALTGQFLLPGYPFHVRVIYS